MTSRDFRNAVAASRSPARRSIGPTSSSSTSPPPLYPNRRASRHNAAKYMAEIYGRAGSVVIWLGEEIPISPFDTELSRRNIDPLLQLGDLAWWNRLWYVSRVSRPGSADRLEGLCKKS